jgi:hypothetical protein
MPENNAVGAVFPDNLMGEHDGFYYALLKKLPI